MKRHPGLVPLSRDHHHGLVMAERLVLGRSTNPRADWPSDRAEQAARLLDFFETDLAPHFDAEEAHVFPVAARDLVDGDGLVQRLVDDHEAMRSMVHELGAGAAEAAGAGPTSPRDLDDRLRAFGKRLRRHIRIEERELFERMQAECPAETLREIETRLTEHEADRGPSCRR